MGGPPMPGREAFLWEEFRVRLRSSLRSAKGGKYLGKENYGTIEKLVNFFDNIEEHQVIMEDGLRISHTVTPQITDYSIRSRLAKYIGDKKNPTNNSLNSKYYEHYDSKDMHKLIGDLKNCCKNMIEDPNNRIKFGHEAKALEEVIDYMR